MIRRSLPFLLSLLSLLSLTSGPAIAQPQWSLVKPSNTGIPGEAIETIQWAPNGDLWVGARWPNYEEGGIGVFDFETEIWSGWSNFETPLPSEYINDIDFDANGVAWISTEMGLARLEGKSWTSPTLAHGKLYLRNHTQMVSFDLK